MQLSRKSVCSSNTNESVVYLANLSGMNTDCGSAEALSSSADELRVSPKTASMKNVGVGEGVRGCVVFMNRVHVTCVWVRGGACVC